MTWKIDDPQGNEAGKVKYDIVPYTRGRVLDLGCGPFKAFPHFIGVDNGHHANEFGWQYTADIEVATCERLEGNMRIDLARKLGLEGVPAAGEAGDESPQDRWEGRIPDAAMDAVFSSHLLEHIEDTEGALTEWWRVIKPGGHLVLYLPHKGLYPNVGELGANPDHKHDFVPADVVARMMEVALTGFDLLVSEERDQDREYSFLQVYRKREDGVQDYALWERLQFQREGQKRAIVVRYGGIGDMIMMSSILPQLKDRGYHVTVMTTPIGREIVAHDRNIDEFMIQDTDQVPNPWLAEYWHVWAKKVALFVNLSESVEGNLLPLPGTSRHGWPDAMRQKYLNENYLEFQHQLAGMDYIPRPRFYATDDEKARVARWRDGIGRDEYVVLWCLSGSSPHKTYPHTDAAVAMLLMKRPNVRIVFVGDEACRILEGQWEAEARVIRLSGKIGIRETLALACHGVDCVVGPETGVLNAVSHLKVPKVIMLSHSSVKNLTRNWANTVSLMPDPRDAPCFPCHRLHVDRTFCPDKTLALADLAKELSVMDEHELNVVKEHTVDGNFHTGGALCAYGIPPERVAKAILEAYAPRRIAVPA